jgi:hypothetical protein
MGEPSDGQADRWWRGNDAAESPRVVHYRGDGTLSWLRILGRRFLLVDISRP